MLRQRLPAARSAAPTVLLPSREGGGAMKQSCAGLTLELEFEVTRAEVRPGAWVVAVRGVCDPATAPALARALDTVCAGDRVRSRRRSRALGARRPLERDARRLDDDRAAPPRALQA